MMKRALSLLGLSIVAACSASSGERSESSHEALSLTFGNLTVTPTDTTITIAYEEPGTSPLAVTLGGQTLTATYDASGTTQNQSVTFSGLEACTSYGWSIPAFSGAVTGQTNTRLPGGGFCGTTGTLAPYELDTFHGMEHQESNNAWCDSGNWSPDYTSWPIGEGWNARNYTTGNLSSFQVEYGYGNWSNDASGPLPCAESIVEARRAQLKFKLAPWQLQRATNATFVATLDAGPTGCLTTVTELQSGPGVQWEQEPSGGLWAPVLGIPESSQTIIAAANPAPQWPMTWSGRQLTVSYGKPTDDILVGFETNDGFANGTDPVDYAYAAENAGCMTTLDDTSLQMTYTPMPPETPLCTGALSCTETVTCAPSAATFVLESSTGATLATFDGTGGATPTFTVNSSANEAYTVCTQTPVGSTCAPVTLTSIVGCACEPKTCDSYVAGTCGSPPDGCGGTLSCGSCASGSTCTDYQCVTNCTAKVCGSGTEFDKTLCACVPVKPICICGGTYPACEVCK